MANEKVRFLTPKNPVARLVGGSVGKAQEKDADGKPYTIKSGPNMGKPTVKYYTALAIPKQGEAHWVSTEWGQKIWAVGHGAFPGIAQSPQFAWKVEDGDSQIPNTKGKKPCDRPGYKGNWILHCSTSLPIKACNADGSAAIDPAQIKCGYYVQAAVMCAGNNSSQKPGIYLNPEAIALVGVGEEIVQGLDTAAVGFGGAQLPPGASAPPNLLTGAPPVPGVAPAVPGVAAQVTPPIPGAVPPANPAILGALPAVPGVAVPPAPPAAPAAPPAPPAGPQMTPKAAGQTYEAFRAAGWSDEAMRANGYLL